MEHYEQDERNIHRQLVETDDCQEPHAKSKETQQGGGVRREVIWRVPKERNSSHKCLYRTNSCFVGTAEDATINMAIA